MFERLGRIERHVRFVLVFAQPSRQIVVAIVAIFIENKDHCAYIARKSPHSRTYKLAGVPVPDRFPQIDTVQNRRRKGSYAIVPRRASSSRGVSEIAHNFRSPDLPADRSRSMPVRLLRPLALESSRVCGASSRPVLAVASCAEDGAESSACAYAARPRLLKYSVSRCPAPRFAAR